MNIYVVMFVVAVAAVVYFVWSQRSKPPGPRAGAPARLPAAAPAPSSPPAATSTPSASGPLASYDDYRKASPSNMLYGKLTCNRCGSNLIRNTGGTATCTSCGAALYRA